MNKLALARIRNTVKMLLHLEQLFDAAYSIGIKLLRKFKIHSARLVFGEKKETDQASLCLEFT